MPILVGLTGGIGSGKTTIAKLFEELDIPVYYSDDEAKKLYENPDVQHRITDALGVNVFEHGILNRKLLAEYIFSNPEMRDKINAIIHPQVRENFGHFCEMHASSPYVINEAAILFETGTYKKFQFNILVIAPENIKIERLKNRDNASEETIRERMKAQWNDEQKMPLANFIINNDGVQSLKDQVMEIHQKIMTVNV